MALFESYERRIDKINSVLAQYGITSVDEAYAGDIIGLFDPGIFSIGDTLCTGKKKVQFAGIPTFSPEHFARIEQKDTMKRKQFVKGMEQIAQEGAIQIFREVGGGMGWGDHLF